MDAVAASSRIFVKGLPSTFTEAEFRKHFSSQREVTDAKIFPSRRIGYVGYKTPEDAQKAVKYFNRTFIRMSKIGVEIARPIQDEKTYRESKFAPTMRRGSNEHAEVQDRNTLKRKRVDELKQADDPKLKEFLDAMKPKSKRKAWESEEQAAELQTLEIGDSKTQAETNQSDEEYEEVPKNTKRRKPASDAPNASLEEVVEAPITSLENDTNEPTSEAGMESTSGDQPAVSDSDWARSRTSRLLGLLDDEEEEAADSNRKAVSDFSDDDEEPEKGLSKVQQVNEPESSIPTPPSDPMDEDTATPTDPHVEAVRSSMRLFVRNLPYDVKESDLETEFESFGNLEEVHVPLDTKSGSAKGFAYIQFSDPDSAQTAMDAKDGQTFQGRLLHIIPAKAKRETKLDDFALSKLPLKKQQQIKRRRDAASATFNWNALYMNADAVVSSVADRLGLSKSEVLDPTSSDAAIKQAHAETHIIQETKAYFRQQGVDLDSFKKSQRGDTAILVKNIPYDCSKDELKRMFEEHGEVKKFLMPPSGVIAIIEFSNAAQCKSAFGALAYRKIKSSVLFLEKAPKGLLESKRVSREDDETPTGVAKTSASELKDSEHAVPDTVGSATLFVRNLNFTTTSEHLSETFQPLEGFLSGRVKTKTDPKKPGQVLSMGFGFLEFRASQQAQAALKAMDGYTLEGHKLQIRASHKGLDAAEERRKADAEKRAAGKRTKVVIKNLPFEASKKDVRALFGAYGQLRSVRVPKKMDRAARGFAFADFTTPKEAESAMDALKDTHLLGRRLVLDFADDDPEDAEAEIQKMQQKVGAQVNKVALQKLTSGGRKKFSTQADEGELLEDHDSKRKISSM